MSAFSHDDMFDSTGFSDDDDYQDENDRGDNDYDQDAGSDDDQSGYDRDDNSGNGQGDEDGDGASAIAGAAHHEVEAHRNMIGDVLAKLSDNGIDIDDLAERAGVDSSDVNALSHDDLASLTQYVTQHHPGLVDSIADRYPAAQGILNFFTGR